MSVLGLYARVSTDEQNIKQQVAVLKDYAARNEHEYRIYSDFGVSRSQESRPSWDKLIKDCEEKRINGILVLKLDRITGSLNYGVRFWEWLKTNDIKLYTIYEGVFDYNSGDNYFVFMLKILLSEKELMDLRYRSRIGIERAKKEGKYKGRVKGSKNK
jgi:site-specific DNA recombinase